MLRTIGLCLALIAAAIIGWLGTVSPHPRGADAPAGDFSALRAFEDVKVIAARPHAVASPANQAVRDYLLRRMTALGLSPRVQAAPALTSNKWQGAYYYGGAPVENLIGVLPGKDPAKPALAIMAHYDSVPGSPGAADDAAGVASALEIARALKAGPRPERDVVFLITDGEEAGLLGARAFFASDDPAKAHIGAVINMEARGGGGRAAMFQTAPDNGGWIDLFRANAKAPIANSAIGFVYERMPNDTDFTVSKAAGKPGLNFAFIGREFDYHSPSSTPAALDKGALQSLGGQALAAARAAALAPALPAQRENVVYSQVFGDLVAAYPLVGGWVVLGLAAVLIALAVIRSRRAGQLLWPDVGLGVGLGVYLVLWTAALLELARRATGAGFGGISHRELLAAFGTFEAALFLLLFAAVTLTGVAAAKGGSRIIMAIAALLTGALCSLFGGLDIVGLGLGAAGAVVALIFVEPIGRTGAWAGLLLIGLVAGLAVQILAPPAAFVIGWCLLAGALAAAASTLGGDGKVGGAVIRTLIAGVAMGWMAVYAHFVAQALDLPAALALFALLAAIVAWPLFQSKDPENGGLTLPLIALTFGAALIGLLNLHAPWTARHPRPTEVVYVADQTDGSFWRVSLAPKLDDWSRAALTGDGGALTKRQADPLAARPLDAAKAMAVPAIAPTFLATDLPDGRRQIEVHPAAGAQSTTLSLRASQPLSEVSVEGLPVAGLEKAGQSVTLRWSGDKPFTLRFHPGPSGQLAIAYSQVTPGWPLAARKLPVRPDNAMAYDISDSTVVRGRSASAW